MKKGLLLLIISLFLFQDLSAQGPRGKSFGFGITLGDPLGATIKYWTSRENAFTAYLGTSYFGSFRIGGDYLWHFDAFNTPVVKLFAGPGLAVGFGHGHGFYYKEDHGHFYYRDNNEIGVGARVIFGLNIIPKRSPVEIYLELGPMIGFIPETGVAMDAAVGIRFYP
jgi:hypothetical protein